MSSQIFHPGNFNITLVSNESSTNLNRPNSEKLIRSLSYDLGHLRHESGDTIQTQDSDSLASNLSNYSAKDTDNFLFPDNNFSMNDLSDSPLRAASSRFTSRKHPSTSNQSLPSCSHSPLLSPSLLPCQLDPTDDDSALSIEVPRGHRTSATAITEISNPPSFISNNPRLKLQKHSPLKPPKPIPSSTTTYRPNCAIRARSDCANLRRDIGLRHASAFRQAIVPNYAETSAKVRASHLDSPAISKDGTPVALSVNKRNSRFSGAPVSKSRRSASIAAISSPHPLNSLPSKFVAGQGLNWVPSPAKSLQKNPPLQDINEVKTSTTVNITTTRSSFAVSDVNFTELATSASLDHIPIASIPVPDEEREILSGLQSLKERISLLEIENKNLKEQIKSKYRENSMLQSAYRKERQLRIQLLDSTNQKFPGKHTSDHPIWDADNPDDPQPNNPISLDTPNLPRLPNNITPELGVKLPASNKHAVDLRTALAALQAQHLASKQLRARREAVLLRAIEKLAAENENDTQKWNRKEKLLAQELSRREIVAQQELQRRAEFAKTYREMTNTPKLSVPSLPKDIHQDVANDHSAELNVWHSDREDETGKSANVVHVAAASVVKSPNNKEPPICLKVHSHDINDTVTSTKKDYGLGLDELEVFYRENSPTHKNATGVISPISTTVLSNLRQQIEQENLKRQSIASHKQNHQIDSASVGEDAPNGTVTECTSKKPSDNITSSQEPSAQAMTSSESPSAQPTALSVKQSSNPSTPRPAEPPLVALDAVVKELESEMSPLQRRMHSLEMSLICCDPSIDRSKRKAIIASFMACLKDFDKRADRVYRLADARLGLTGHPIHSKNEDPGQVHVDSVSLLH